jgi:hypothetical protein
VTTFLWQADSRSLASTFFFCEIIFVWFPSKTSKFDFGPTLAGVCKESVSFYLKMDLI